MIDLAADGLKTKVAFVDELVPVERVDHLHVALLDFDHLLLQHALGTGDAAGFEAGEILRDDLGGQSGDRVRQVVAAGVGSLEGLIEGVQIRGVFCHKVPFHAPDAMVL